MKKLSQSDAEFFKRVYDSAFLNPFTAQRLSSDASALGKDGAASSFEYLGELLSMLDKRLSQAFPVSGSQLISHYSAPDAKLLEVALLFQLLHRHREGLDSYIRAQSLETDRILPADCAKPIFSSLRQHGIATDRAESYVSIIFQMRRAYYFISKGLMGDCPSMRNLRTTLWNAVFTCDTLMYFDFLRNRMEDFSTLLLGETGTGKGAAAQAMGLSGYIPYRSESGVFSENFAKAFLAINLSEFAENLIESELFGHKKGSFTGAVGDHAGIFSRCSRHGAIFLDEIGDISEQVQIKLLHVLQHRNFSPVGGHEILRFGGRVIAATNQDLAKRRKEGKFRNDFYYRLSSSRIELPTLRERIRENPSELGLLLLETVRRLTGEENREMASNIEEALRRDLPGDYPWPGNVRELEQAARSVILTGGYPGEDAGILPKNEDAGLSRCLRGEMTIDELLSWYCGRLYSKLGSYGAVASRVKADWRTVKQRIESKGQ